jgi:thiamine biosynthesis lipoprotein
VVEAVPAAPRRAVVEQIMGMPVSVHVRGDGARGPDVDAAIQVGLAGLRRADAVFSTWRSDSAIQRLRRGELSVAQCPPEVAEVIALGEAARTRTAGWFEYLLDDGSGTRLIEPTGLVKGWAVERALTGIVAALERAGWTGLDVAVNAGGDVAVHRAAVGGRSWLAGIEDPADRSRVLTTVTLTTGGIATSGSAARGAHIVNPFTGERVARGGSVTVYGPSLMWADVFATAAFAYGDGCLEWLRDRPGFAPEGYGAVVVTAAGLTQRV